MNEVAKESVAADIFRAYDVRGVVGKTFGPNTAFLIARSLASLYPQCSRVMVGRDGRLSSEAIADAIVSGLRASGADAVHVGVVPTSALYYAAQKYNDGTGLMVTGSHNPPEYNGIKMMMAGDTLSGDAIQDIYKKCLEGDFVDGAGARAERMVLDEYVRAIIADVDVARGLRVVIDCGNGVAGPAAMQLFAALAEETRDLYCDIDGRFPNHHPNPSDPKNMEELARVVVDGGYDVGFAFDGDGDRLGVVDSRGRIVWPDRQMMVYARDILGRHAGAVIIYDVKSSRHLAAEIERHGGRAQMCRTGHSFVKSAIKETGAHLAGEMSGHIFFNDRWPGFDDGLYAAARMLELLARESCSSADFFDRLPDAVSTPELNITFEREGAQYDFMRRLERKADFGDAKVITLDGLRVELPDGWGLVRASNTTPSLVIRFEADNDEALRRIQDLFRAQLRKIEPELAAPF